jgi:teichoic acid transport system permease protein
MTATSPARDAELEPVYHDYGPHRAGLPPLMPYFRELWYRRAFVAEMSRATMRSANTSTFFGQAWLIINPILLAAVYYILVTIIRRQHDPAFFALSRLDCSPSNWWARRSPAGPLRSRALASCCLIHPFLGS